MTQFLYQRLIIGIVIDLRYVHKVHIWDILEKRGLYLLTALASGAVLHGIHM